MTQEEIEERLGSKINLPEIRDIVNWAHACSANLESLLEMTRSADTRTSANALWCLTHIQKENTDRLQSRQDNFINMLLAEQHVGKRRMLLQLLREQYYDPENIRTDFLDYCLTKINSECEPYAIRAFSIYCAFKMCRFYPELVTELKQHLDMLELQPLSPGLRSALNTTRKNISRLKLL